MTAPKKKPVARKVAASHGGSRLGAGRPPKIDSEKFSRVTITLRKDTIEQLRAGANHRHFGEFLQWHLDRHPIPTHEIYQAILNRKTIWQGTGKRRIQVLYGVSKPSSISSPRVKRKWSAKDLPHLTPALVKKLLDGKNAD